MGFKKFMQNLSGHIYDLTPAGYGFRQEQKAVDKQNLYNAPKNSVKRLREAGLNPALMYGTGSATSTGEQKQIPKYQSESSNMSAFTPLLEILGKFADVMRTQAQSKQAQSLTTGQDIENTYQKWYSTGEPGLARYDNKTRRYEGAPRGVRELTEIHKNERTIEQLYAQLDLTKSQKKEVEKRIDKIGQDTRWQKFENDFREKHKINMSESWRIKVAVAILQVLGQSIDDNAILNLLKPL